MRRGELLGLRWQDVDLDDARVSIRQTLVSVDYALHFSEPKTKRLRRTIGIDPATVAALRAHLTRQHAERLAWGSVWKDTGLVFTQEDGSPVHPQSVSEAFDRHAMVAGLPVIRFHDVRHTYATLALEAGMRPWDLSDRLGHSDTSMALDVYRHAIRSTQDEAARRAARFILGNE
jgi:integrase